MNIKARHKARRAVLQALYQWRVSGSDLSAIEMEFHHWHAMAKVDTDYFHQLLHDIPARLDHIEAAFTPHLDRSLDQLNMIELNIMRMGTYELMYCQDIPYKVVINEALELAKSFGANESYKYINAVLDKVASDVRNIE